MKKSNWTREESILALALYCKIPFSKINHNNAQIKKLADFIDRTPSAVSMKMGNFGRLDPELAARGISGLSNGSRLDCEIWNEFHQNMEKLFLEAEKIMGSNCSLLIDTNYDLPLGEDLSTLSTTRKGHYFFRSAVLSAYNNTCCVTGINIPKLLQASHIKSWKESNPLTERTNPINGLCLNALHHKAFDYGIITIDTDYKILISKKAKDFYLSDVFNNYFVKYEGKTIRIPNRFLPSKELIHYHNSKLLDF